MKPTNANRPLEYSFIDKGTISSLANKSSVEVSVIEVKDPAPINPKRKAANEAKNLQPLGFGSKIDVGTTGNWE